MIFPFYKFKCPGCKNPLEFHSRLSGNEINCPSCGDKIELPPPGEADGKNTWGNWCKGIFLATSALIIIFILALIIGFLAGR